MTRARVDVHRKDNVGSLEKAITIFGNPENCTNACKKILEVMQQESNNTNKGWVIRTGALRGVVFERLLGFAAKSLWKYSPITTWLVGS